MHSNGAKGIAIFKQVYDEHLRELLKGIFARSCREIELCINNAYKSAAEVIQNGTFSRMNVPLLTFLEIQVRSEAVSLLKDVKNSAFISSDIAASYSRKSVGNNEEIKPKPDLNKNLSLYKRKELDFFIRRFFYLQDKQRIMAETKIRQKEFQKLTEKFKKEFLCGEEGLINLASGIDPMYLKDFYVRHKNRESLWAPLKAKTFDLDNPVAESTRTATALMIICFSITAIGFLVISILRLFMT